MQIPIVNREIIILSIFLESFKLNIKRDIRSRARNLSFFF